MSAPDTGTTLAQAFERVGQHFLNVIYFDGGRYVIAAGVLTLFLLVFSTWAENRRIQRKRRASAKDYRREVLSSGRTILVFAVTTLATLIGRELGWIKLKPPTDESEKDEGKLVLSVMSLKKFSPVLSLDLSVSLDLYRPLSRSLVKLDTVECMTKDCCLSSKSVKSSTPS